MPCRTRSSSIEYVVSIQNYQNFLQLIYDFMLFLWLDWGNFNLISCILMMNTFQVLIVNFILSVKFVAKSTLFKNCKQVKNKNKSI